MSAIPVSQAANLHLLDLNSGRLQVRLSRGLPGAAIEVEQLLNEQDRWAHILDDQRPLLIQEARPAGDANNGYLSAIIAPLIQETETIGMLSLIATQKRAFSEGDFRLLASFASTAATAMQNAQLHSAVQYLAITDPLTGVYNRRGFFEQARQVMHTAETFDRPVSVLMLDIDFFKHVNDEHGHDAGDTILQALAERSRKALRDSDLICRYGGEEFAYLLPESDEEGSRTATRRLFDTITATPVQTINGPITFTISIGVATRSDTCLTLEDLLKCADSALFQAKQSGRNQVRFWQQNPQLGF
jgi:diguanylate cyclase (GGDEF)-like protein